MRVAPISAQALVAVPPSAKAIHNYNPTEPGGATMPLRATGPRARRCSDRPTLRSLLRQGLGPPPHCPPRPGGGPFLSSPAATDPGVNMAFLATPSRPQPDPGTAQDWHALQAMHPASGRTIGRTYGTLEAALNWGVVLMRRGYYIEIWSPSFLEDRRDALLD
jgi:hypothetical protein